MSTGWNDLLNKARNSWLPKRREIILWSSIGANDGRDIRAASSTGKWYDGTDGDSVEFHGGENNGSAQRRLAPANGKYATLDGLSWMADIRSPGIQWSQNPGDDDVGGGSGYVKVPHDFAKGGPNTRLEHVHVIDCAGYDRLTLHWQMKCLNYEGLAMRYTGGSPPDPTKVDFVDNLHLAAMGMPSIDSKEPLFSLPKMFMVNDFPLIPLEASRRANPNQLPGTGAVTDLITFTSFHEMAVGDGVTFTASAATGLAVDTLYYVIADGFTTTAFKVSTVPAGAAVDITVAGAVTLGIGLKIFAADAGTDVLTTTTAHGLSNNHPVQLWNSGGALPAAATAGNLTMGRTYYARDVTATTMKLCLHPGLPALNLTDVGTGVHGLSIRQTDPGTSPYSQIWPGTQATTGLNWSPQRWVHGADLLYYEVRSALYPGDDRWWEYKQIGTSVNFEGVATENAAGSIQGVGSGPCMTQFGRAYVVGATKQLKWIGPGDKIETTIRIGYPPGSYGPQTAAMGSAVPTTLNPYQADLRITGLARIGLSIGSIAVNWDDNWLVSDPIAPSVAPRQHNRGRLIAVLSRD